MKTKEDIHIAMAGLTALGHDNKITDIQRTAARLAMSVLCWVLDYPTNFDETFKAMKKAYGPEFVEKCMAEALRETAQFISRNTDTDTDTHTE